MYVFGGRLPSGLLGLVAGLATPYGPVTMAGDALLWLSCTPAGRRMAGRRRFVDHRRWMVRNFALTMSIITNRVYGVLFAILLSPQLETTFHGDETLPAATVAGLGAWLGWILPLPFAEWWLERGDAAPESPSREDRRSDPR
ncbi:Predicted membrane protein [Nonomuraea solani]|uniref:Predicted membrane protein n=1 Tax=Nonomuraea solani TaxID=1144553 RepID=A0A1H6EU67_9ACTN|nr:Predicted membrane protein [Nonomuraea solani]